MGKYLVMWEINISLSPVDPKERADGWNLLMDMVSQDIDKGIVKDWAAFPGEVEGYFIAECSEVELGVMTQQYFPYCFFKVRPAATLDQVREIVGSLSP